MALEFQSLTRRFGDHAALDRVSLHVRRGDCYGFLGHNGAGKTTALRIGLGLMTPDSGRVLVDGFDVAAHPREARARMGGLVEVPGFHDARGGPANLETLARLQGMSGAEARAEAARGMEWVGLEVAADKPVGAYSQGMRQRLGIAQALLGRPPYVLLDEPTNGLDPEGIAEMRELFARLVREEGVTILLSSHQLHEITGLCNRVAILREGRRLVEDEVGVLLGAGAGRHRLDCRDPQAARNVLAGLEIAATDDQHGTLEVMLGDRAPEEVARELVLADCGMRLFAPVPPTLEEIYLRHAQASASEVVATAGEDLEPASSPEERLAPRFAVARLLRAELARVSTSTAALGMLLLPAALGAATVIRRRGQARPELDAVGGEDLFSVTGVTAFEGVGLALQTALPLIALVLAGLASQSVASELARGTLRNVLLRPITRVQLAAGKILALFLVALGSYLATALVAAGVSAWAFDFGDVAELLPNGASFTLVPASELWPELRRVLLAPVLPLFSYVAAGFFFGCAARSGAAALGSALLVLVLADLSRVFARAFRVEEWLPSAYLPSPLGDTSFLQYYLDVSQGVSNADFAYSATAIQVPLAWTVVALLAATWIVSRRSVP